MDNIAGIIDHTLLKPDAPLGSFTELVRDTVEYKFSTLCVNPFLVPLVSRLLNAHPLLNTKLTSVIAFPFGVTDIHTKSQEIQRAVSKGAHELDVVANLSLIKTGDWKRFEAELSEIREASEFHVLKIILEVGLLTHEEIVTSSNICLENGVNFLKTSTGVNCKLEPNKTAEYVALLKDLTKGTRCQVKASGGIKTLADLNLMVQAGATRVGTSNSVEIMKEFRGETI